MIALMRVVSTAVGTVGDAHDRLALWAARTRDGHALRLVRILDLFRQNLDGRDYTLAANALIRDQVAGDHENPADDPELGDHT
jgi:hypothetical protein